MYFMLCSLVLTLVSLTQSANSTEKLECPSGWIRLNTKKCIMYSHKKFTFPDAVDYCRKNLNSKLLMIKSKDENKEISLMFEELQLDEYFWLGGKVKSKSGDFEWLDECEDTSFSNFHINNHDFNLEREEEYLVLSSAFNENANKRKERGLWCSFNPQIMLLAICQYYLVRNGTSSKDCKKQQTMRSVDEGIFRNIFNVTELIESPFTSLSRTHIYFIIASTLMMILLFILLIIVLRARFSTSSKPKEVPIQIEQLDMY